MIPAYKIGVDLALGHNAGVDLGKMAEAFEALDKIVSRISDSMRSVTEGAAATARAGAEAARNWRQAAEAMERAAAAAAGMSQTQGGGLGSVPNVGTRLTPLSIGGGYGPPPPPPVMLGGGGPANSNVPPLLLGAPAGGAGGGGGGIPPGPGGFGAAGAGGPRPLLNYAPRVLPGPRLGFGTVLPAYLGYEGLRDVFEDAIEPEDIVAKMRAARFTDAQVERSRNLAMQMMRTTPGFGYAQGLDLINQTTAFTGNFDEAARLSPGMARNAQVLSLYGQHGAIRQVESAAQAGELTGLTNPDGSMNTAKLSEFITRLTQTVVASGGQFNLPKYLTGIRQFGVGADSASMDFTTAILPAFMKIMGESRAGTALSSLQQSLGSTAPRTQNKSITAEQERLGLRDEKGNLQHADVLQRDPREYIMTVILPALHAAGMNTVSEIVKELPKFLPRQTMARLVAAGIFDEGVIEKEANRNREQQAAGAGPLDQLLKDAPSNQMKAFHESWKAMMAMFGDAALGTASGVMQDITKAFGMIAQWAKDNPEGAAHALEAFAGGIALFAVGTAAGAALTFLSSGGGVLIGIASGITALAVGIEKLDKAIPSLGDLDHWTSNKLRGLFGLDPLPDGAAGHTPSGAPVTNQSYHYQLGGQRPIIRNVIYLDGRDISRNTAGYLGRAMSAPDIGPTGFDPSVTVTHPSHAIPV